jgi:hypothetical protein
MKGFPYLLVAVVAITGVVFYMAHASGRADGEAAPVFGIKIPPGYRDWKLISVAHEEGNLNDLRALLGNDLAIKAYREASFRSRTAQSLPGWPGATFRLRKTTKSLAVPNRSWPGPPRTFSLWSRTQENTPRRAAGVSLNSKTANLPDEALLKTCFPCHEPVKARDFVFTRYAP